MANVTQGPVTSGIRISRTPTVGNEKVSRLSIGAGAAVPTSGLIWWNKK